MTFYIGLTRQAEAVSVVRIDGQAAARARRIADGSAPARRRAHRRRRLGASRRRVRPRRRRRWMRAFASGCRCRAPPLADRLLACAGTILSWCCCCESCTPWKHRSLRSICQHFTCEHHHLRNQARNTRHCLNRVCASRQAHCGAGEGGVAGRAQGHRGDLLRLHRAAALRGRG